ncbi:hypothetical protein, partial [Mesorhizobium sp. M4B.F.Ca.ET.089.01.1.1]|uniref:hypothetical protein n=1 Tax=Mesorhizobium sp. M4B.F.Ca.ET.089.01.1.1 TaxID=2496662 RepID=UPI001AEC9D86
SSSGKGDQISGKLEAAADLQLAQRSASEMRLGSDGIERIERYPGTEPIHRNILLVFLLAIPALVWVSTIWKQSQISFASNPPLGTITSSSKSNRIVPKR